MMITIEEHLEAEVERLESQLSRAHGQSYVGGLPGTERFGERARLQRRLGRHRRFLRKWAGLAELPTTLQ